MQKIFCMIAKNKKILGLDLGTNSIGWALVEIDHEKKIVRIIGLGSRILTMDTEEIRKFESGGKLLSSAAQRTDSRSPRRLNERFLLRRDRLHCVLNLLQCLPEHYKLSIEFENEKGERSGKFKKGIEEKFAYIKDENGKSHFLFMDSYKEMRKEFEQLHPELFYTKRNGKQTQIPYDWTLYYLRKKALQEKNNKLTKEELAWITLSFNQKRGYEKVIGQDEKEQKEGELRETFTGKVKSVKKVEGKDEFKILLVDFNDENVELYNYTEESKIQITFKDDLKEVEIISKYDEDGNVNDATAEYIINEIKENLRVVNVKNTNRKNKENFIFEIELETGWLKEQQSKFTPKWKGIRRDFIIKTKYDKNGNRILKEQDKGRSINIPKEEDWTLMKLKTETSISAFNVKNETVGVAPFIYYNLLQNPNQKIKNGLVTVIEREFYEKELEAIYTAQEKYHPELKNRELYKQAVELLYPNNENHRQILSHLDFKDLIGTDILFYQRDLKSKKSLISDCEYETENYTHIDTKTGKSYKRPLKAIHKSNPLYQEFRLWQFIKRLKIFKLEEIVNEEILLNQDVSKELLTPEIKEKLFEFLNNKEDITQKQLLKHLEKLHNQSISWSDYKWNFPIYDDEDKKVEHKEVCNPTRYSFILRTKRIKGFDWEKFLTAKNEYLLWHFFYSVKKRDEFVKGLNSLIFNLLKDEKNSFPLDYKADLVKNFSSFVGYNNDYGTYSEKAIKKLLPFMRIGKYWNSDEIEKILATRTHEIENKAEKMLNKVIEKENINGEITDFQGLWLSSACYLVYGRYSEVGDVQFWDSPYDIENYIRNEFKQHSLNNPVVERILRETLHIVKDIWMYYGEKDGEDEQKRPIYKKLFDEIHIELGREMKKNNKQKEKEYNRNKENRKTNERIIELLKEFKNEYIGVQEKSPFQQAKLKILEEDLLSSIEYDKDSKVYTNDNYPSFQITKKEIKEIVAKDASKISKSDIERYRLWLDQRYQSPYTGKMISLSNLFDRKKYEIEHIFPQERVTLNALSNKVICETEVNKAKEAYTGYEFILKAKSKPIFCAAYNKEVEILSVEKYEELVKRNFTDKKKQEILLSKDIPDEFSNSQGNNSQYIAKMAMKLMSNIVREKDEDTFRSKHVLATNGAITSELKRHWQLNEMWNEIVSPRYKRLNDLTNSSLFGDYQLINGHKIFVNDNQIPKQIDNNFDPKRIDHRHHALDALIIALTTENHVNYLNNISSQDDADKLQTRKAIKFQLTNSRKSFNDEKEWYFLPPAQTKTREGIVNYKYEYKNEQGNVFKDIAKISLEDTIATFKQKNRIIRQRWNKYLNCGEGNLNVEKEKNLNDKRKFAVRQSLHKDTFYGKVNLSCKTKTISLKDALENNCDIVDTYFSEQIVQMKKQMSIKEIVAKLSNPSVQVYEKFVASRYGNELESFANISSDKIIKVIENVTDTGIQQILKNHLKNYDNNPQQAFSYDGIKAMNEAIAMPEHGLTKKSKPHKPIYKVRLSDAMGTKFQVSEEGTKNTKYVVTKEGSNVFCGVYENKEKERKFYIPTLRESIECLKQGLSPCPENHPKNQEFKFIFALQPNDLVYVPNEDEVVVDINHFTAEQYKRIYKFRDASENKKGGIQVNFMPANFATMIYKQSQNGEKIILNSGKELKGEITLTSDKDKTQNLLENTNIQIRSVCIKLNIDRLGNIKPTL